LFTGIVEEVGRLKATRPNQLSMAAQKVVEETELGDSIAVNGACLTVTALDGGTFSVDIMPETLRRTNLGRLRPGNQVNLERAMALGSRMGGHLVQGHVDGTGRVLSLTPENQARIVRYSAPPQLMRYIVPKGFIAVDGVSLTVIDCDATSFRVSLVAYTLQNTTLAHNRPGDLVNLEIDIVAKYLEGLGEAKNPSISIELLAEHGFLAG
jgi:riboflavin synthase